MVRSGGVLQGGQDFVLGLEALSDFTTTTGDELVCVQAKRTLTTTAMAQAAVEFATIADFLQSSASTETMSLALPSLSTTTWLTSMLSNLGECILK